VSVVFSVSELPTSASECKVIRCDCWFDLSRSSQSTAVIKPRAAAAHTAQRRSNLYPGFSLVRALSVSISVARVSSFHARCVPSSSHLQLSTVRSVFAKTAFGFKHCRSCRGIIHHLSHSAACAYCRYVPIAIPQPRGTPSPTYMSPLCTVQFGRFALNIGQVNS
jgi:hypothetical protein